MTDMNVMVLIFSMVLDVRPPEHLFASAFVFFPATWIFQATISPLAFHEIFYYFYKFLKFLTVDVDLIPTLFMRRYNFGDLAL